MVETLKGLMGHKKPEIRLGAIKLGLPYIMKNESEAGSESLKSLWQKTMTQPIEDIGEADDVWGDSTPTEGTE